MRWQTKKLPNRVVQIWEKSDPDTVWALVSPEWGDFVDVLLHRVSETDTVRLVQEDDALHLHFVRYPHQPITLTREDMAEWTTLS